MWWYSLIPLPLFAWLMVSDMRARAISNNEANPPEKIAAALPSGVHPFTHPEPEAKHWVRFRPIDRFNPEGDRSRLGVEIALGPVEKLIAFTARKVGLTEFPLCKLQLASDERLGAAICSPGFRGTVERRVKKDVIP